MEELIRFALGNFTLTFFVLGLVAAAIAIARKPDGFTRANVAEELLAYFILFSMGFSFLYNFATSCCRASALHRCGSNVRPMQRAGSDVASHRVRG